MKHHQRKSILSPKLKASPMFNGTALDPSPALVSTKARLKLLELLNKEADEMQRLECTKTFKCGLQDSDCCLQARFRHK
eukprot:3855218-Amphidinium_carterae.1